jgi:N-dimethylarginine dimethylaminohydrolase
MPKTILMCPPEHFDIEYEINPWMCIDNRVQPDIARAQCQKLHNIYSERLGWEVQILEPVKDLPDTANGALVIDGKVALPRLRHPERQGETPYFEAWFRERDFEALFTPVHDFEGEGDALPWNDIIFAGFPWRSDRRSHTELADFFGRRVVSLQLTDARFYHLDTALTVVDRDSAALYPRAFTAESLSAVRELVPNVIEATGEDAIAYGLNAVSDGRSIVLSDRAADQITTYRGRGMNVQPTPIGEFQKSGGGAKCLSLELRPNGATR